MLPTHRGKSEQNITYRGASTILTLLQRDESFAFVVEPERIYAFKYFLKASERDFDLLEERLGKTK